MTDRYITNIPVIIDGTERTSIRLIITDQVFSGGDWPRLACAKCHKMYTFIDLLRLATEDDGTKLVLFKSAHCCFCEPRLPVPIRLSFRTPVSIRPIRGDDGAPFRWLDQKKRRWLAIDKLQFRFMDKNKRPLDLRLQPYKDRKHAHDGTPYEGT